MLINLDYAMKDQYMLSHGRGCVELKLLKESGYVFLF